MGRRRREWRDDEGAAIVELLGLTLVVLVPIVYAVIALAQLQAATYAVEGASRTAARAAAVAGMDALADGASEEDARAAASARADALLAMALEDFGVRGDVSLVLTCAPEPCFAAGSAVIADVAASVPLPGIPDVVAATVPVSVDIAATGRSPIDGLAP